MNTNVLVSCFRDLNINLDSHMRTTRDQLGLQINRLDERITRLTVDFQKQKNARISRSSGANGEDFDLDMITGSEESEDSEQEGHKRSNKKTGLKGKGKGEKNIYSSVAEDSSIRR